MRVVILTGAGEKSFVAGADINELAVQTPVGGREHALAGQHVFDLIENLGKPVIAAINGFALGGGCELAMACTLRLAADTAKLGQPEIALGLLPGYAGTQRLPRLVGKGRAMEMILTGAPIAADEAQRIGLVNRVVPAAELMAEARKLAGAAGGKRADRDALHHQRGEQGPRDAVRRSVPVRGDAVRPGRVDRRHARRHAAFLEKRKPEFKGSRAVGRRACDSDADDSRHGRAAGFRFALVVSKYNDFVTDRLQAGALAALAAAGVAPTTSRWSACRARSRFRWRRSTRPRAGASTPSSASAA